MFNITQHSLDQYMVDNWHTFSTLQGNDFVGIDSRVGCPLAHIYMFFY